MLTSGSNKEKGVGYSFFSPRKGGSLKKGGLFPELSASAHRRLAIPCYRASMLINQVHDLRAKTQIRRVAKVLPPQLPLAINQ